MVKEPLTIQQLEERHLEQAPRDTIPFSVATDLLCAPGHRCSNSERKAHRDSRYRIFTSTEVRKPREVKIAGKMSGATIEQLDKWLRRATKRRRGVQRKYSAAVALAPEVRWREKLIARLNFNANLLDTFLDAADDEVHFRGRVAEEELLTRKADLFKVTPAVETGIVSQIAVVVKQ